MNMMKDLLFVNEIALKNPFLGIEENVDALGRFDLAPLGSVFSSTYEGAYQSLGIISVLSAQVSANVLSSAYQCLSVLINVYQCLLYCLV